jgi:hypothetical protein
VTDEHTLAPPADWEKITPHELIPAVKHIRQVFGDSEWKYSQTTQKLCYAELHPGAIERHELEPYEAAFRVYSTILGPIATREFYSALKDGTPPAIFKAYFDAYRDGLKTEVRYRFNDLLQVGLANTGRLNSHPVEWAKDHLALMINRKQPLVAWWIKSACDKPEDPELPWRAPWLISMRPSGNFTYHPAGIWNREDQQESDRFLEALTHRFIESLEIDLAKTAGAAHVTCAKEADAKAKATTNPSQPADAQPGRKASPKPAKLGPKKQDLSRYFDSADLTEP